jgi:hypothetical protein
VYDSEIIDKYNTFNSIMVLLTIDSKVIADNFLMDMIILNSKDIWFRETSDHSVFHLLRIWF